MRDSLMILTIEWFCTLLKKEVKMLKNLLIMLLISVVVPLELSADWVSLNQHRSAGAPPRVTILSNDANSTVIKIDISGFQVNEFMSGAKTYQSVDLITEMATIESGLPELSYIAKVLAVPDHAGISVEVLETSDIQTFANIYLPPARESWVEGQPETPFLENLKAYQSDEIYPASFAQAETPSVFRDFRIARISFFPLRYIASEHELQVVSSMTVRINYTPNNVVNPKTSPKKEISPSFGKLYRSFIFNYQEVLDNFYGGKESGNDVMLCIMPDEFVESFQPYADWKHRSGTYIHVTKFSEIGATSSDETIIKNHISDAYFNWDDPPTYVLLVGDDGVFPVYSGGKDNYFAELEGNDYFPDVMIGRFTNQSDYGLQVMINKFLLYEKNPYTTSTDWFKKGICCSNNAYVSQIDTKRFAAERMLLDGGFTSVDTMMSSSPCNYSVNDVIAALNDGRSFLNYRGEGWSSGWWASCTPFNTSNIGSLSNGQKFTFVTSIGCGVAMFASGTSNCFGEEWLEMGTLSSPKGAVAFIGPVGNTHTTYNNKIDKGIYVGMFQEGLDTPGQALVRGKLYMYNVFGNVPYVESHYKLYDVLGDPSVHVWKEVPLAVEVDHVDTVTVGYNQIEFTATYASNGLPVANAELCLAGDGIYEVDSTDALGNVIFDISPQEEQNLTVTLRGGNVAPYMGNIEVIVLAELVEPVGEPLIVDLDGNLDGLINPNENGLISLTLVNWGNLTAANIQATLSLAGSYHAEVITTAPQSYGDLEPGGSFSGNPFQFFIEPDCPVGEIIPFQLHITSNTTSWNYTINVEVMGCRLLFDDFVVIDENFPKNFRMDPGETLRVVFSIENKGEDFAPDAMGILSSTNPYITIEDSVGSFGTININGVSKNFDDYFVVTVDELCPTNILAEFSLKLFTLNGNYPYQTNLPVYLPIAMPIPTDYTGPDAYGYSAFASSDAFYEQTPVYSWVEIDEVGTQIDVPGVSDYTETVVLPFTFKYYGVNYDYIRISTDGWIALNGGGQIAPINGTLPSNDNVNNMVAVFWDDLYDVQYLWEGDIYYYYDNPNHRFIIEWDSISHNDTLTEPKQEIFQAILLDPAYYTTATGDGEIIFQYKKVISITSNSVGIENDFQDDGLQYVFDQYYDATASTLVNQLAIKFTTEPAFTSIITADEKGVERGDFHLDQNFPNPFNKRTSINFTLPEQSHVSLSIYNIKGELVRVLYDGRQSSGKHRVEWNGLNDEGKEAASGIYFYRLQSDSFIQTKKMSLLK